MWPFSRRLRPGPVPIINAWDKAVELAAVKDWRGERFIEAMDRMVEIETVLIDSFAQQCDTNRGDFSTLCHAIEWLYDNEAADAKASSTHEEATDG